jgi:uncharacterized protein YggE
LNGEEKIGRLADELQVLAFNLMDELETINFHSNREAVADLRRRAVGMADEMQVKIKDLLHNLQHTGRDEAVEEAKEMASLLDVVHNISTEQGNFKHFISILMPLIRMLSIWGDRGPLTDFAAR